MVIQRIKKILIHRYSRSLIYLNLIFGALIGGLGLFMLAEDVFHLLGSGTLQAVQGAVFIAISRALLHNKKYYIEWNGARITFFTPESQASATIYYKDIADIKVSLLSIHFILISGEERHSILKEWIPMRISGC